MNSRYSGQLQAWSNIRDEGVAHPSFFEGWVRGRLGSFAWFCRLWLGNRFICERKIWGFGLLQHSLFSPSAKGWDQRA